MERVRTSSKAWARAIDLTADAVGSNQVERLAIVHVRAESEAIKFYRQLNEEASYTGEVLYTELTPGLSVHAGAGMLGVGFVVSE